MSRINSNVAGLIAQTNLANAQSDLQVHLERLSTGLRINSGADDPSGLIISQRLATEIAGLNTAVSNTSRAQSVISTADGALSNVGSLLTSIQGLIVQAANTGGTSASEAAANQLQIDSAIDSITRISNSTSFGGLNLLNGSLDYIQSGVNGTSIANATVTNANFSGKSNIQVNVQVVASAQVGALYLSAGATNGTFASSTNLQISGPLGVQTLSFSSGQALSSVAAAIARVSASTGVSAALINPANPSSGLKIYSQNYGSNSFVSVKRLDGPANGGFFKTYALANNASVPGTFSWSALASQLTTSNYDTGRDVSALVNGTLAAGNGLNISLQNASSLSANLTLTQSFATTDGSSSTFYLTGGGANFQLGGQINTNQQVNIGIQSVAASNLGGTVINNTLQFLNSIRSGGANALATGNFQNASAILQSAIDQVSDIRGRLGAFEANTLTTNSSTLQTAIQNLTSSESNITDADFASETSALSRAQIISSAATSVLSLANSNSQQVLKLLQ